MWAKDQDLNNLNDEEFIEWLYAHSWEDKWARAGAMLIRSGQLKTLAASAVDAGIVDSAADYEELLKETLEPSSAFRGRFIADIRNKALAFLEPFRAQIEEVPVVLGPTGQLNGRTIRTPRGGSVILLDAGVLWSLSNLIKSYLAFYSWHHEQPYCRDLPQWDFAKKIYGMAILYAGKGVPNEEIAILDCPSIPIFEEKANMFALSIEILILLHEYGHLILGPVSDSPATESLRLGPELEVAAYARSQLRELQADAFAYQQVKRFSDERGLTNAPEQFAFAFGILLRFIDLCELVAGQPPAQTHPTAYSRWKEFQKLCGTADKPDTLAYHVDPTFDAIVKAAGLERRPG